MFTPDNAWQPPFFFTIGDDELMIGLFRQEGANIGYIPALCRKEGGVWRQMVTRSGVYEQEFDQHYPNPEAWADANIKDFNDWLEDEYGESGPLSDYEKWLRDMAARYHQYTVVGHRLGIAP